MDPFGLERIKSTYVAGIGIAFGNPYKLGTQRYKDWNNFIEMIQAGEIPGGRKVPNIRGNRSYQILINALNSKGVGKLAVENMYKFFELPFGKSIKNSVQKTNGKYNGASVWKVIDKHSGNPYLKKGDRFYIDTESFDHIEVFDKRGRVKAVLDMNGNYIEAKTKKNNSNF